MPKPVTIQGERMGGWGVGSCRDPFMVCVACPCLGGREGGGWGPAETPPWSV